MFPLVAAALAAGLAYLAWRLKNFSDRWYALMEFLHEHPGYMDAEHNRDYMNHYKTAEARWEYESIARMCIAYVDDAYFLQWRKNFKTWLRGTIPLLVGRHYQWFQDNKDSYDPSFVQYVESELKANATWVQQDAGTQ